MHAWVPFSPMHDVSDQSTDLAHAPWIDHAQEAAQHSEQATAMVMLPGGQLLTVCCACVRHPACAYV